MEWHGVHAAQISNDNPEGGAGRVVKVKFVGIPNKTASPRPTHHGTPHRGTDDIDRTSTRTSRRHHRRGTGASPIPTKRRGAGAAYYRGERTGFILRPRLRSGVDGPVDSGGCRRGPPCGPA